MKNKFLFLAGFTLAAVTASAQTDTLRSQRDSLRVQTGTDSVRVQTSAPAASGTAVAQLDSNLPEHLKGVTSSTVLPKHYLPVLGSYTSADGAVNLNVVVDEQNMGIVWIEGLPQGRVKGLLKKAPATYKIPAQKTAEGKAIAEGTLVYDKDAKQLSLCTGCTYNEADPTAAFSGKSKAKVWQFTRAEVSMEAAAAPIQQ